MAQKTERVFELHWRQLNSQQWRAVLTDPETKLQYHVTSKLAFRTVLANLTAAARADPRRDSGDRPAEEGEAPT